MILSILEYKLNQDNTSPHGTETTSIHKVNDGNYESYVYNFLHKTNDELMKSGAKVQIFLGDKKTPYQTFIVPQEQGYIRNVLKKMVYN